MRGVILYGPPAAGKDTVTRELSSLDSRYVLFPRLKVGSGRTTGYRMATTATVDTLRANGLVIWENHRYDATYVVDRPGLVERLHREVPVLHLGQPEAIDAVVRATPQAAWLIVHLWCPRDVAAVRIERRQTGDTEARLRAWDETPPAPHPHLVIDTSATDPQKAARRIQEHATNC